MNVKKNYKKYFVRNTEEPIPKTIVHNDIEELIQKNVTEKKSVPNASLVKTNFNTPKVQSTLGLSKQITSIENLKHRKIKSLSDIDKKKKLAIDEKLTRKVNFRYDQPIYKDLIPLCVRSQPATSTVIRDPLPLKDKEPNLNEFYKHKALPEYKFQIPVAMKEHNIIREYNGTKLYKIMRNWDENL